jgi:hypothetical protein
MYVYKREGLGRGLIPYAGGLWRSYISSGAPGPAGNLAYAPGISGPTMPTAIEPVPTLAVYADLARKIIRKRGKGNLGIVLSMVLVSSGDTEDLIDRRTEKGKDGHLYLKNPPAHVVMPPRVYEIEWKPGRGKRPQKIHYVWILSNEKSAFPVGGILFLSSPGGINSFLLATFNTGSLEDSTCTNAHHAEMHATGVFPDRKGFIDAQPKTWRERVGTIHIVNLSLKKGLGYSPCNFCCEDLALFLTELRALRGLWRCASITWLTLYNKNKACGHPTDIANLRKLASAGWELKGPGWPLAQRLPSTAPPPSLAQCRKEKGFLVCKKPCVQGFWCDGFFCELAPGAADPSRPNECWYVPILAAEPYRPIRIT